MKKKKLTLEELTVESFITSKENFKVDSPQVKAGESAFLCMTISISVAASLKKLYDHINYGNHQLELAESNPRYLCDFTRDPKAPACPWRPRR